MREFMIESEGLKYAEDRGWTVYKWSAPGYAGVLDRLHFKKGISFAIEYKAACKKASPRQRNEAGILKAAGIPCRCVDNVSDARNFIDQMTNLADQMPPALVLVLIAELALDISSFDP